MILRIPDYYEQFRCIADRCKDSCCIGWEIDIDEDTYEFYRQVDGELGKRLKRDMYNTPEGEHSFRLADHGRCPFLNDCNLCDIISELGEEAISEVCTEYPRFAVEYGDVLQKCMSLSCEEVGRFVFTRKDPVKILERKLGSREDGADAPEAGENPVEEEQEEGAWFAHMENLQRRAIALLQDRNVSIRVRMADYLNLLAEEDGPSELTAEQKLTYGDFKNRLAPFLEMETLDGEWRKVKQEFADCCREESYPGILSAYMDSPDYRENDYEQLLVYFTFRYLMNAVYDYDIATYGKLALVFTLVIRDMNALRFAGQGGHLSVEDQIDTARIFSKEVEHSEENIELAKEAFLFEDIFRKEALLRQI